MTSSAADVDATEDVNDFLLRIRELGEKRDKEDEERTKKLEEEILQGRKERQARRAERARSISPTKDSPLSETARLSTSSLNQRAIDPPEHLEPTVPGSDFDTSCGPSHTETTATDTGLRESKSRESGMDYSPRQTPTPLRSRAGTLSWQQRPSSRDLNNNPSFGSTSPTRANHVKSVSAVSDHDQGLGRERFAAPLASKDASLRQTTERESETRELRKTSEDAPSDVTAFSHTGQKPHGLCRECPTPTEPEKLAGDQDKGEERQWSPSRPSSTIGDSSLRDRYSSVSSVSTAPGLGSPIPLSSAQKFEVRKTAPPSEEQTSTPPSPRRMSPERSGSPTKGLGGFVQSAMMKRSDSVSKRWSTQMPSGLTGLSRTNSIVSNRNSVASPTRGDVPSTPTGAKFEREGPPSPYRPNSSHSEATVLQNTKENERPATPPAPSSGSPTGADESPTRKPRSLHARSSSALGWEDQSAGSNSGTPLSSRTMDSKRWSPTKASWLESALNRPETPRHMKQPSQSSPLSRERQSRGSVDLGRRGSFKEVTPVGLMRSTAPGGHYKKSSVSGIFDTPGGLDASKVTETKSEHIQEEAPEPIQETPSEPAKEMDKETARETTKDMGSEAIDVKEDNAKFNAQPTPESSADIPPPMENPESSANTPSPPMESASPQDPVPDTTAKDASKGRPAPLDIKQSRPLPSASQEPAALSPRPQSPVVDFRGNLRRREPTKENSQGEEPEFKNVFGKLRRTQTRNYVAPDELKENILRGKAALNVTGGPKKTPRVDEFKESLVKQKEAMKAGGGSVRRNTAGESSTPEKPVAAVPEAIAKRNNMASPESGKGTRSPDALSSPSPKEPETPRLSQDHQESTLSPLSNEGRLDTKTEQLASTANSDPEEPEGPAEGPISLKNEKTGTGKDGGSEKLDEGSVESKLGDSSEEANKPVRALPSGNIAAANAPATEGLPTKGKLAGRINPALAGLLSRGPPAAPSDGPKKSPLGGAMGADTSESPKNSSSGPLTHMTKNRARAPRRRAPKASVPETTPVQATPPPGADKSGSPGPAAPSSDLKQSSIENPIADSSSPSSRNSPKASAAGETTSEQTTFSSTGEPTEARTSLEDTVKSQPHKEPESEPETAVDTLSADVRKNGQPDEKADGRALESQEDTSPREPAIPTKPISPQSSAPTETNRDAARPYSPPASSPLRTNHEENGVRSPGGTQQSSISKFGIGGPRGMPLRGKSLPLPPDPRENPLERVNQPPPATPSSSLISDAPTSKEVISSFFKSFPTSSARVDIDPQSALTSGNDDQKIKTLKKQIWEITGDVKRQDLPMNQEYILYEGSMYLCIHVFEIGGSTRTEAQLWCGDDVPESSIEDAQSFARKVAKENGCKLELLKQGKETARFIQALGGILITRRGFNSRSSSSALYMLCGRRHLGQMVFDEVDLSRRNLCSGYPFVVSAPFGNLYLWKGKGSGAEEVGAARLIGMDLGLTGEIEEVTEGEEPETFFENFPDYKGGGDYVRGEYWQLKPNHAHFRTRLLRLDHELGQRSGFWMRRPGTSSPVIRPNDTLQEITPFSYKDLTSRDIFILDIFFEIYVIVGDQASHHPAEFASAVVFAHEYGILAASLQDRPFIPKTFVSIGGLPDSCRSVFRKWDRRSWQVPLRVLTLNAAIEAIRS